MRTNESLFELKMEHGLWQFVASVGPKPPTDDKQIAHSTDINTLGKLPHALQAESTHIGWVSLFGLRRSSREVVVRWETDQVDEAEALRCGVTGLLKAVSHLEVPAQITRISMADRASATKINSDRWLGELHDITGQLAEFDAEEPNAVIWPSDHELWKPVWTVSPIEDPIPRPRLSFE